LPEEPKIQNFQKLNSLNNKALKSEQSKVSKTDSFFDENLIANQLTRENSEIIIEPTEKTEKIPKRISKLKSVLNFNLKTKPD